MANKIFDFIYWRIVKPINNWRARQHWNIPAVVKKNKELQGKGTGKVAFLLATGPSIKEQNLKLLAGQDCYSLSNFFLHDDLATINPKYHFFAPYHAPLVLENYIEWLKLADQKLPQKTGIFLGWQDHKIIKNSQLFQNREVRYLHFAQQLLSPRYVLKKKIINPSASLWKPTGGVAMILPILLYMEYSKIFLIGCDQNALREYKISNISNFYTSSKDIRSHATEWNSDILTELKMFIQLLHQYQTYQQIGLAQGTEIINLSHDSWLDFLPYQPFEKIFTVNQNFEKNLY